MSKRQSQLMHDMHGFDKEVLLGIYSALNAVQLDYNERKWETVRTASLLTLGLLAGVGGIVASDLANSRLVIGGLGVFLLLIGTAIVMWTRHNMNRESSLQYHVEFPMYQIEKLLGVHEEVPESLRWFPSSRYIFGQKHLSYQFRADIDLQDKELTSDPENVWVRGRLKQHTFIGMIGGFTLILLSVFLFIGGALLTIAIWGPSLQPVVIQNTLCP
jgi:hypothetical protein